MYRDSARMEGLDLHIIAKRAGAVAAILALLFCISCSPDIKDVSIYNHTDIAPGVVMSLAAETQIGSDTEGVRLLVENLSDTEYGYCGDLWLEYEIDSVWYDYPQTGDIVFNADVNILRPGVTAGLLFDKFAYYEKPVSGHYRFVMELSDIETGEQFIVYVDFEIE